MSTPGARALVRLPSGNQYMMERGDAVWHFLSPTAEDQAYVALNPMPPSVYNPFKSHVYLSPGAGSMEAEYVAQRATSVAIRRVSQASFSWAKMRIIMADITGTPIAPEGIWFGVRPVGNDDPAWANTWVAATGLVAPPAGTDDEPGVGPACDYVSLPSNTDAASIVVRIQMPSGTITRMNIPTNYNLIPDFASPYTKAKEGTILADPTSSSGWSEAFGQTPWFVLEVADISTPQCVLGGVGDSHMRGYRADAGGQGTRGMIGEMHALQGTANLNLSNFARSGHNAAQISKRMRVFEAALDLGGWLHQRASVNDRNEARDYTLAKADAAYALLQSDYAYLRDRSKIMIPIEGAGSNAGTTGWYARFTSREADEVSAWPARMYDASSVLNADGSYKTDMVGPDGGHPSLLGYQTWAGPSWISLQSALTAFGVSV